MAHRLQNINNRKSEHIQIVLGENVTGTAITTGFERYHFLHNALPELDFRTISLATDFLSKKIQTPFLISSMTGGTKQAEQINQRLAEAAEEQGWAFALGSTRAMLESNHYHASFQLRNYAPTIPIIANLGAVQLNYGYGLEQCQRIIALTAADALVLHLNSLQEVIQPEGDTNFDNLLRKIEQLTTQLNVPVGIKEVGWGIDGQTAKRLTDVGVAFIDVAGAGGTSWSQVEKHRTKDVIRQQAATAFADWGIPTADCLVSIREQIQTTVIASGGMKDGVDAAKAFALGAHVVGFGRAILQEATQSTEAVIQTMKTRELELAMAMFGIGVQSLEELAMTKRLIYK